MSPSPAAALTGSIAVKVCNAFPKIPRAIDTAPSGIATASPYVTIPGAAPIKTRANSANAAPILRISINPTALNCCKPDANSFKASPKIIKGIPTRVAPNNIGTATATKPTAKKK